MLLNLIFSGDFMSVITYILSALIVVFFVLPFHEWAHGFVAYKLGDRTAKQSGRLTLNPLAHIDPFGSMLLLLIGFGWAKPVPVDSRYFKNPKVGMSITALAGPVANLLAAVVSGLIMNGILAAAGNIMVYSMYTSSGSGILIYVLDFFMFLMTINISLAVFNLIPIPPLDGIGISWLYQHEQFFSIALFIIVMAGGFRGGLISNIQNLLFNGINWLTSLPFAAF